MELHGLLQSTGVLMPRQMETGNVDLNTDVKTHRLVLYFPVI